MQRWRKRVQIQSNNTFEFQRPSSLLKRFKLIIILFLSLFIFIGMLHLSEKSSKCADEIACDPIVKKEFGDFRLRIDKIGSVFSKDCELYLSNSMEIDIECFKLQRDSYRFSDQPLRQIQVDSFDKTETGVLPSKGLVLILSASTDESINDLKRILPKINEFVLRKNLYDLAIFHEDFSDKLMLDLSAYITYSKLHFVKIEFSLPVNLKPISKFAPLLVSHFTNNANAKPLPNYHTHLHGLLLYGKRKSFGYYHMCRFFSGAAYMLPFFDKYEWMMRFDTDMDIRGYMPDYFSEFEKSGKEYGYYLDFTDGGDVVEGLWNFTRNYILENKISPTFLDDFNSDFPNLRKVHKEAPYPDCANYSSNSGLKIQGDQVLMMPCITNLFKQVPSFYTNFEISKLSFLKSLEYQKWFKAVDESGNFYLHRWGDAPIRFLALSMYMDKSKIAKVHPKIHHP